MSRLRAAIAVAVAVAAAMLLASGCDVSGYFYFGPGDDPPSVSLAASPATASQGETIGLVAAASDDYRVVDVTFFRIDPGGNILLGRDSSAPYTLDTVVPAESSNEVRYLARAVDDAGQQGESRPIVVAVR